MLKTTPSPAPVPVIDSDLDDADATSETPGSGALDRDAFFNQAPSPWQEIRQLEYGGDHTFATLIQNAVLTAPPPQHAALEKRLLAVLADRRTTMAAQDFICRMLAIIGSESCVDALMPLLVDEKMSHYARLALERIPGKKVDAALWSAVPRLTGAALEGLLGTIAVRKTTRSVPEK
ncbi:MAG: hypothetical protein LBD14_02865 [Puniceicoccales bacterium]|jgi:hypothetical protein|nr:hypothetical protein [Puniceicoccales bacterium]